MLQIVSSFFFSADGEKFLAFLRAAATNTAVRLVIDLKFELYILYQCCWCHLFFLKVLIYLKQKSMIWTSLRSLAAFICTRVCTSFHSA